ncbi:hypothetical protein POJ06DRAFT_40426 [Lipomyces tetrasporus]|uniref:Uncharacterized protein n=1 Tax=Lipomyces tetrasporus TaxID=54092 RepID=A0AAD7QKY3_9ASCO|nr:uncharacterized protein POJ06DRAFT_40426 [Lipomyces tetrasporus]KAJ8097153.1 hypothetical protein POJ06DRAFT_40426 [Lipomyces tetrasporus]
MEFRRILQVRRLKYSQGDFRRYLSTMITGAQSNLLGLACFPSFLDLYLPSAVLIYCLFVNFMSNYVADTGDPRRQEPLCSLRCALTVCLTRGNGCAPATISTAILILAKTLPYPELHSNGKKSRVLRSP